MDDGGTQDELDPQPDTDELVVPVWRALRGQAECDSETIASSLDVAPWIADDRITHARVREALKFLQEHGYANFLGGNGWKATDKSLTASEQEVAALWTSDEEGPWQGPWHEGRSEHVAAFATAHGFTFTDEAPSWLTELPVSWLRARNCSCRNAVAGTWGHTQFIEFDHSSFGVSIDASIDASAVSFSSCAVTRTEADFPERTILVPSEQLDRLQLRRRWRSTHPAPTPFRFLQAWARRIGPKRSRFRDALLDREMFEWLVDPAGPVGAIGRGQRVAFTVTGPWIVCDTPLLAPTRLGDLLEVLDGFSRRIPEVLSRESPAASHDSG